MLLLLLLSLACVPEAEPVRQAIPVDAGVPSPPPAPGALSLTATPFVAGEVAEVVVRDANPFETVHLARGAAVGPGPCPPPLGGLCLDITRPSVAATVSADAEGTAVFTIPLSTVPAGVSAALQAVAVRGLRGADSASSEPWPVTVIEPDLLPGPQVGLTETSTPDFPRFGFSYAVTVLPGGDTVSARIYTTDVDRDLVVVRQAPDGTVVWAQTLGHGREDDDLAGLAPGPDGSVYVAYRWASLAFPVSSHEASLARLGPDGAVLWARGFSQDSGIAFETYYGDALGLAAAPNGDVVLMGTMTHTDDGLWPVRPSLLRVDPDGDVVWDRQIQTWDRAAPTAVAVGADGTTLLGGDDYLWAVDASGETLWDAELWLDAEVAHAAPTHDGGFLIAGGMRRAADEAWVFKVDGDGRQVWSRSLTTDGSELATEGVHELPDPCLVSDVGTGLECAEEGRVCSTVDDVCGCVDGAWSCHERAPTVAWPMRQAGDGVDASWFLTLDEGGDLVSARGTLDYKRVYAASPTRDGGSVQIIDGAESGHGWRLRWSDGAGEAGCEDPPLEVVLDDGNGIDENPDLEGDIEIGIDLQVSSLEPVSVPLDVGLITDVCAID